jgi:hypothetical protein
MQQTAARFIAVGSIPLEIADEPLRAMCENRRSTVAESKLSLGPPGTNAATSYQISAYKTEFTGSTLRTSDIHKCSLHVLYIQSLVTARRCNT